MPNGEAVARWDGALAMRDKAHFSSAIIHATAHIDLGVHFIASPISALARTIARRVAAYKSLIGVSLNSSSE